MAGFADEMADLTLKSGHKRVILGRIGLLLELFLELLLRLLLAPAQGVLKELLGAPLLHGLLL